jgi:acyl-CoA synthetase (AMP-forming)/AMP-acid ligase II
MSALPRTLSGVLAAAARESPDTVAVIDGERRITVAQLHAMVGRAARGLVARGLRAGERVAVWGPNSANTAIAMLAVPVAGGVVVPLNTRYTRFEVGHLLRAARCRLIIAQDEFLRRSLAAEAVEVAGGVPVLTMGTADVADAAAWSAVIDAGDGAGIAEAYAQRLAGQTGEDVVVVQFTSGSTGRPKGALLCQGPMIDSTRAWVKVVGMTGGDVYPVTYPLAHVGGLKTGLVSTILARATAVLFPVIDTASLVAGIQLHGATVFNGPPTVLRTVLQAVTDGQLDRRTAVRVVVTGSAVVPQRLVRELSDLLGVRDVVIAYGLTEATGVCTMTRRGDPLDLVCTTIGGAIDGVQLRVVDQRGEPCATGTPGEIEVRGETVMAGYLDDTEATDAVLHDGWLRTGDVGWLGEDGYVRLVDRVRDLIVVGGFNVSPAEVEQAIAEIESVAEVSVVGVADERLGEVPVAFVVPRGSYTVDSGLIVAWCREHLANFKVPRHVWAVDALPRTSAGKVAKPELRIQAGQLVSR